MELDNCPFALQSNSLNIKNHLSTIEEYGLGPADPRQPNDEFWADKAAKWGIPSEKVLQAIMESNFSKKQADGSVLKDAHGKVIKGPNFKPPEPAICRAIVNAGFGNAV